MTVGEVKMKALMDAKGRDAIQQCVASNQGSVWLKSIIHIIHLTQFHLRGFTHSYCCFMVGDMLNEVTFTKY